MILTTSNILVAEEGSGCRRQASVQSVNQGVDVARLLLHQVVFCAAVSVKTNGQRSQMKKKKTMGSKCKISINPQ